MSTKSNFRGNKSGEIASTIKSYTIFNLGSKQIKKNTSYQDLEYILRFFF